MLDLLAPRSDQMQTHRILLKLRSSSDGAFYRPLAMLRFVAAALIGPFVQPVEHSGHPASLAAHH